MCKKIICLASFVLVLGLVSSVSAGLVAHWQFDDGAGTTAVDSSGNGHDGTLLGDPEWVAGIVGSGALSFDGTDDLVEVGDDASLSLTDALTITVWVKVSDLSTFYFLVCKQPSGTAGDNYSGNYEFRIERDTGALQFLHQEAEGEQYTSYTSDSSITAEQWYHVAVVVTKGELVEFYIDGVAAGSAGQSTNFGVLNDEPVRIGGRKDAYSFFNGVLDDVRLYDRTLSSAQIEKLYNGIAPTFRCAEKPDPADGAMHMDTWASLSWSPGDTAASHDVYFGDNFDDVNAGAESTFQGNQAGMFFVVGFPGMPYPDGLVPGTSYYWRIDEVNDTEPNSPWKGDVWSIAIPPKTAYDPTPANGAKFIDPNVELSWTAGFGGVLHTVYFGDNFDDVNNAAGGLPQGITTYTPGTLKLAKTYYWRVDEFDAIATYKGDVWSFTTQGAVGSPDPSNGAVDVKQTPVLSWSPGIYAASHQVYFGSDAEAVKNADTGSPEYKGSRDIGSESYDPGKLEWDATYYWRIDEVNDANPDSPWAGFVWSFTTANFLIVDDFEGYDANDNQIWYAWKDGLGYGTPGTDPYYAGNGSGSAVGDETTASYTEETIVHGGSQSMPLSYDNNKQGYFKYSEVELTLSYPRDWTEKGVSTLTIWFRGDSDNAAESLYVALNGSAVVSHDNADAAQVTEWTQWNIELQQFADQGVNLANVNTIALGLGNKKNPLAGGAGTMYFDDIRLYVPEPEAP